MSVFNLRAACAHLLFLIPLPVPAQGELPQLTLQEAVARAMTGNPELRSAAFELKAAHARQDQARSLPNPQLSLEVENFAGTGEEEAETTLALSQAIDLAGRRSREVAIAGAERELAAAEQRRQQLDVLATVVDRFIEVVVAQERLALARKAETLADATEEATKVRVSAGRLADVELSRAAIARARARLQRERAEQGLWSARQSLAVLWGDDRNDFVAVASLFEQAPVPSLEIFMADIERNPEVASLAAQRRLRDAELQLAEIRARPALEVSAGARRFDATGDTAFVAGISLPLALFDRNRGGIAAARATVEQAEARQQAGTAQARATLRALYQELTLARRESELLRAEVIPHAERALQGVEDGFRRGRFSYLELVNAQRELLDSHNGAIEAAATAHRLLAQLERVTGKSVATQGDVP